MVTTAVGKSLLDARQLRGYSREELAARAGLSWGAIAQIESGRRTEVRLSTLRALAAALGLTIDELIAGTATRRELAHEVLLYSTQRQFVDMAAPFLHEGVENDERPIVVTTKAHITALKRRLGDVAPQVAFVESDGWLQSPAAALSGFREYVDQQLKDGAQAVRVLGEPLWIGRSPAQVRAWTRFESLFNVVFAHYPMRVICPYNTTILPADVLQDARRTHPLLLEGDGVSDNPEYAAPEALLLEY